MCSFFWCVLLNRCTFQDYLADLWKTEVLLPASATGTMSHPRLPGTNDTALSMLSERLYSDYDIYTIIFQQPKGEAGKEKAFWLRLSSQIFLERSNFQKLGEAVLKLCRDLQC
jgi:hypothetical protein